MRITRYSDYSIRVLIFLALKGSERSTIKEIADSYGISKNHLMKVVHDLQLKGYVETIRGKGGGLSLGRRPEDINLGELLRSTETDINLLECFGADNCCVITPACSFKNILAQALKAFLGVLDQHTLADLVRPQTRGELGRLLSLEGIPIRVEPLEPVSPAGG